MTISEAQSILHCPDAYGGIHGEKYGRALGVAFKCMDACGGAVERAFKMYREQTKEEAESVDAYIKSISKPTGVKIDDF